MYSEEQLYEACTKVIKFLWSDLPDADYGEYLTVLLAAKETMKKYLIGKGNAKKTDLDMIERLMCSS